MAAFQTSLLQSKARKTFLTSSPKRSKDPHCYSAVVAIDFGTTYSGYAYAFTSEPDAIFVMNPRGVQSGIKYGGSQQPTVLLLTQDEKFHSFGYEAQEYYRDVDERESVEMLYFEKFKMELHSIEVYMLCL